MDVAVNSSEREKGGIREAGFQVRPYRPDDREEVRRICCDTGFLGRPIDPIFHDRELFADLMTDPYLLYEPEWAFVAECKDKVVGYLLGSGSTRYTFHQFLCGFHVTRRMFARLLKGAYRNHPRSRQFLRWMLTAGLRERPRHPPASAHLHFNLEHSHRGIFIGKALWNAFVRRTQEAGIRSVYGEFFSYPGRRPEQVYTRYGFVPYDRVETTLFRPEVQELVEVVCMHRRAFAEEVSGS